VTSQQVERRTAFRVQQSIYSAAHRVEIIKVLDDEGRPALTHPVSLLLLTHSKPTMDFSKIVGLDETLPVKVLHHE
jgi:hypothetical protein